MQCCHIKAALGKFQGLRLKALCSIQGEGNGAFVEGVQKAIATELGVGIADMTNQEKKQLVKQYSKSKQ